jgi:hypothetical protein
MEIYHLDIGIALANFPLGKGKTMSHQMLSRILTLIGVSLSLALAQTEKSLFDPSHFAANLKYTGITYHPGGGENIEHYKRALDNEDYWVLLIGFQADADYLLRPFLYLRASTSLYRDCSDLWAGYYHLGFRANWDATEKLSLRIGIGPTYLWRQNWFGVVKGYTKDSFFGPATGGDFQGAFVWYGGDAEIVWKLNSKMAVLYSVIPGYPEVIQNSIGMRFSFL